MLTARRLITLLADPRSGLAVTPLIDLDQVGDASIDLRLGPDIWVSRRATGVAVLDPADPEGFRRAQDARHAYVRRDLGDTFHLQPGEFAIARSLEYVTLPASLSAEVLGRSSWGRLGLTIATATMVQPRFRGTITLELANVANTPLVLHVGVRVAQLFFSEERPSTRSTRRPLAHRGSALRASAVAHRALRQRKTTEADGAGRYLQQLRPELSRIERDRDLFWVTPLAIRYIVGVVGARGAGKSLAVDFLVTRRGYRLYRFMDLVREEAERRGLDARDGKVLRQVGERLRADGGRNDVLASMLFEKIRSDHLDPERRRPPARVVVEGFKCVEELQAFGHLAAFRPLIIDLPDPLKRVARIEQAGLAPEEVLRTLPPADDNPGRVRWLTEYMDDPADGRRPLHPVLERAREFSESLIIDNSQDGPKHLYDQLEAKIEALDGAWRAGRLEPDPQLRTALIGGRPRTTGA